MTPVEIIKETVEFYSSNNRALTGNGTCVYETDDGNKCALGRCLTDEALLLIFEKNLNSETGSDFLFSIIGKDILKSEYIVAENIRNSFWKDLQLVHDSNEYWDQNGLSKYGKKKVDLLISKYSE